MSGKGTRNYREIVTQKFAQLRRQLKSEPLEEVVDEMESVFDTWLTTEGEKNRGVDVDRTPDVLYRAVFEQSQTGHILLAGDGSIRQVNQAIEDLLDRDRESLRGKPIWELLVRETADGLKAKLEQSSQRNQEVIWKGRLRLEGNETHQAWISISPICSPEEPGSKVKLDEVYHLSVQESPEKRSREKNVIRKNKELNMLSRATQAFAADLDFNEVLQQVLNEVQATMGVAGSVWLVDKETGDLVCRQASGPNGDRILGWRLESGEGIAGWAVKHGESVIISDAMNDERHFVEVSEATGLKVRSLLCVPLRYKGNVIGVIQVMDNEVGCYDEEDLSLLQALAGPAAIAVENAQLFAQIDQLKTFNEGIVQGMQEGVILEDEQGIITFVNPRMAKMLGYEPEDIIGHHWTAIVDPASIDDEERFQDAKQSSLSRYTINLLTAGCESLPVQVSARSFYDEGEFSGVLAVFTDISDQKATEERLRFLATHDNLTQLPDRGLFRDRLEHAIERAERHQNHVVVMLVDLDNFKQVNDTMGHSSGDEVLKTIAKRLQESIRKSDTVARFGGDEFTIVLEDIKQPDDGEKVAEKVFDDLSHPILLEGEEFVLSASIGISIYPRDGEDYESLIKAADRAMYKAKEKGATYFVGSSRG